VGPDLDELAIVLADAFVSGPWHPRAMAGRAAALLSREPSWLAGLTRAVVRRYPERPDPESPDYLEAVGAQLTAAVAGVPDEPVPAVPVPVRDPAPMAARHPGLREFSDLRELALRFRLTPDELDWYADPQGRLRRTGSVRLTHYRSSWIRTRSGGARLLEAPLPVLAAMQRTVLREVIAPIPVHPAAHGFVPGRSVLTGARPHVGADTVVTVDLESFFTSITASRVAGVLRGAGYPDPVAWRLAGLCTTAAPVPVIGALPAGLDPDAAFRLRRRLAVPHLPQGAPTSPALSNAVCFRLDRRLAGLADRFGLRYTRYADDLTFSGAVPRAGALLAAASRIVREEGFTVNTAKVRVQRRNVAQRVTGIVVNEHTAVRRADVDLLKAVLHRCIRNGPEAENRDSAADFRAVLTGRVAWVGAVHPARGARLRALLDRIDWDRPSLSPP
jgi:RNA-directed DNA polymerase